LGITRDWQAKWFAGKPHQFQSLLIEDVRFRKEIWEKYPDAGIARVEIDRGPHEVVVAIHTARPGIVIGRGGQRVEEIRKALEGNSGKRVRINIQEVRQPELDAYLVARNVADQIQRRLSHRRAIKQTVTRTMQAGAKGVKIVISGRLGGAEIARVDKEAQGQVPLHTLRADIDYGIAEARTTMGRIGVKVWINRGEVVPERRQRREAAAAAAALPASPLFEQPPQETKSDAPA
jgi:small subunit ribosomal protein S3